MLWERESPALPGGDERLQAFRHCEGQPQRASRWRTPCQLHRKMAAATAPGPRAPQAEGGGSAAASALSMERIQSLTDLADLEAAYSRLCEEEVRVWGRAREAAGPPVGPRGRSLLQPSAVPTAAASLSPLP